jgi:hypothetical protein
VTLPEAVPAPAFTGCFYSLYRRKVKRSIGVRPAERVPPPMLLSALSQFRCGIPKALQLLIRLGLFTVAARATGS